MESSGSKRKSDQFVLPVDAVSVKSAKIVHESSQLSGEENVAPAAHAPVQSSHAANAVAPTASNTSTSSTGARAPAAAAASAAVASSHPNGTAGAHAPSTVSSSAQPAASAPSTGGAPSVPQGAASQQQDLRVSLAASQATHVSSSSQNNLTQNQNQTAITTTAAPASAAAAVKWSPTRPVTDADGHFIVRLGDSITPRYKVSRTSHFMHLIGFDFEFELM